MRADALINCYEDVSAKKRLVDCKGTELAGYYLKYYPNDPLGMLDTDLYNRLIPQVAGSCARLLIESVKGIT